MGGATQSTVRELAPIAVDEMAQTVLGGRDEAAKAAEVLATVDRLVAAFERQPGGNLPIAHLGVLLGMAGFSEKGAELSQKAEAMGFRNDDPRRATFLQAMCQPLCRAGDYQLSSSYAEASRSTFTPGAGFQKALGFKITDQFAAVVSKLTAKAR